LPEQLLRGLLEAAHRAPSVGLMQPWRFVVVRSEQTKAAMQTLAARERLVQAEHFDERARQYLDLKIEGIREAPVSLCVCCDRNSGGREVLGRHTIPDTDLYSTCLAIENLWLAARAEGVGVGWVSFYRPVDLRSLLPLPEHAAAAPLALPEAPTRVVAAVADAPRAGVLIGVAEQHGLGGELRIESEALLQHVHVLGPTGRGKTTQLCNLYLGAARLGLGAAYIEPKGDAVNAVLQRIPTERADDVVLLDLGDELHPPALNLLACAPGDEDVHVQALVGIFARLFGRFWGPRSEDIFRSALATLLANRYPSLPMPTLADVLALLTDPAEKARRPVSDPVALAQFWRQWRALSDSQREQALAPLANKLRAFLGRRALRNVLCQEGAPDFERIIAGRKLLLVSLPARTLGDASDLVGSVIVYRLWQAAQRLGPDPARTPFVCLVDEAHRFCRLPQGLAQALAEARGYRLGFVLAHQHLAQLADSDLVEAVHANTQTKLCFALPPQDAHRMEAHFLPRLDEDDLRRLGRYRLACRISHDGRQLPAATAVASPLPLPTRANPAERIRAAARGRALTASEVEAALRARYGRPDPGDGGGSAAPDAGPPSGPPSTPPPEGGPRTRPSAHEDASFGSSEKSDNDELNQDEDEPRAAA